MVTQDTLSNLNRLRLCCFARSSTICLFWELCEVALNFGADDFGGTLFDENVMQEAGFYNRTTTDDVKAMIKDAGFTPAQRTTKYETLQVFA